MLFMDVCYSVDMFEDVLSINRFVQRVSCLDEYVDLRDGD